MTRLLYDNDDYQSYLVDGNGVEYEESYALAWRYLGMYIDCDIESSNEDEDGSQNQYRFLENDDGSDSCYRKILWAAYVDPKYRGGSIGEYQYYDWYTDTWDDSSWYVPS